MKSTIKSNQASFIVYPIVHMTELFLASIFGALTFICIETKCFLRHNRWYDKLDCFQENMMKKTQYNRIYLVL